MSDQSESPSITLAKAPFDKSNADLILRSSDNVAFRVFKQFLCFASPFFEHTLSLPQPVESGSNSDLPVISLSEPGGVVEKLLTICYPRSAGSVLGTLEEIQPVLEAATKYDMEDVRSSIQEMLVAAKYVENEIGHLRVFCIAFRYGLKDAAIVAMRHTLRHSAMGRPYVKELELISAKTYHQLLDYHWRCSKVAVALATLPVWLPKDSWGGYDSSTPQCEVCRAPLNNDAGVSFYASKYWISYLRDVKGVLRDQPCGTSALRPDVLDKALEEASNCPRCCKAAVRTMRQFSADLAREIEEATSNVGLGKIWVICRINFNSVG
jgi:hypothetical protein